MDKKTFLTLGLAMLAIIGFSYFSAPSAERVAQPAPESAASPAAASAAAPAPVEYNQPTKSVTVSTPNYIAVFNERGGRLESFELTGYAKRKVSNEPDGNMQLVTMPNRDDWPMRLSLSDASAPSLENAPFLADHESLTVAAGETAQLNMVFTDENGLTLTRTLSFSGDAYLIGQTVTLDNQSQTPYDGYVTMRLNSAPFDAAKGGPYNEMGAYINNGLVKSQADDAAEELGEFKGKLTSVDWIGYMDQYFLTALVMPVSDSPDLVPPSLSAALQDHGGLAVGASQPVNLAPGKKAVYAFDFYYGPKEVKALDAVGRHLDQSIDMGWFAILAKPLAALLRWMYGWVGNYGVAIILVTILIKIVLWPLTAKSYRSMKEMQKLQPKVAKLREKYGDDKEAMNREIMQLYKTFKVNPMGGCLPMLLQIPFFIAFYRVLYSLLELRGAPFGLWIQDLAAPDRLFSFNFTIPFYEPPTGIPVLTLLMGLSMVLQQKMTPSTMGDPVQAKMMMMMPIIFTFVLINMPAGLVLYWLVNNILSITQQVLINRPQKGAQA